MKEQIIFGATGNRHRIKILDKSQTDGRGLTGLSFNSAGLIISTIADNEATPKVYTVTAGNVEDIAALGTYAAPTSGKCRFKQVDATNHPGVYELQFEDARLAVAGSQRLLVSISGATNAAETDLEIELLAPRPADVKQWLGVTPNALATTADMFNSAGKEYTEAQNQSPIQEIIDGVVAGLGG